MKRACVLLLPALLLTGLIIGGCNDDSQPRITRIRVSPACGVAPLEVEAWAVASGGDETGDPVGGNNNLEMTWTFGDGGTGSTTRAYHTYEEPGNYNVIVTAVDPSGASASATFPVMVLPDSLMVTVVIDDDDGVVTTADTVQFDVTALSCSIDYPTDPGDAVKMTYLWQMGDAAATEFTGVAPRFRYTTAGSYEVDVRVTYPEWAVTRHATLNITVNDVP